MSLLTLTWREGRVLAPVPVPLRQDGAGMDFGGRGAVGDATDAISFPSAALGSCTLQRAHPSRSSLGKIYSKKPLIFI